MFKGSRTEGACELAHSSQVREVAEVSKLLHKGSRLRLKLATPRIPQSLKLHNSLRLL